MPEPLGQLVAEQADAVLLKVDHAATGDLRVQRDRPAAQAYDEVGGLGRLPVQGIAGGDHPAALAGLRGKRTWGRCTWGRGTLGPRTRGQGMLRR